MQVTGRGGTEVRDIVTSMNVEQEFDVSDVPYRDFAAAGWRRIRQYSAVVFGVCDGYCRDIDSLPDGAVAEIKEFVRRGGGLVWTHDTLCQFPSLFEMSGFAVASVPGNVGRSAECVRILKPDHPVANCPYRLSDERPTVRKAPARNATYSHTPSGLVPKTADIIISHDCDPQSKENFFLTTAEYGAGRVAVLETGHEAHDASGLLEKQALINVLHWVTIISPAPPPVSASPVQQSRMKDRVALCVAVSLGAFSLALHFLPKDTAYGLLFAAGISFVPATASWFVTRE